MTSQQILDAALIDILFEGRNKQYGAYQLRKNYQQQLTKALCLSLVTVFLLLLLCRPSGRQNEAVVSSGDVLLHEYRLPEEPAPKKPEPVKSQAAEASVRQQRFTDHIEIKETVSNPVPPMELLQGAAVSATTTEGGDVGALQPALTENAGTGTRPEEKQQELQKEVAPDRQPQFPGGMQAWLAFLNKNLQAPEELEQGEKRTVVIRFHVAEDGRVTNFKIEQSAGSAFDEEVMRVLRKMPTWTPALKAGTPVSVSFTQPVTFVGLEE
jgi:protein TonB